MSSVLKDLKKQERQVKATFDGLRKFVDGFKIGKHECQISTRLELLDSGMKKFYEIQRLLEVTLETEEDLKSEEVYKDEAPLVREARLQELSEHREQESMEITALMEDLYCELKAALRSLQPLEPERSLPKEPATCNLTQNLPGGNSRVKLPEIRLPSFGGRVRDWVTFRDTFRSLIHLNDQLSPMDKYTYLRASLNGEALQEISTIEMSAANYAIAWELLQKRYENKKLIVKAHLDALFSKETIKRENYEALNHLLSEFDRNLQQLEKIGEITSGWSTILVHMICAPARRYFTNLF